MPNKSAANMARLRWLNTTPEQRSDHARNMVKAREKRKKEKARKK
jgi:acyl-CoA reductase-like NAD-dependent aldehyde dehydrogenase